MSVVDALKFFQNIIEGTCIDNIKDTSDKYFKWLLLKKKHAD